MSEEKKTILVTGGTKGIGKSIILRFVAEGFDVLTCSRNQNDLKELREELNGPGKGEIHTFVADLSKRDEIQQFIDFVKMVGKPIDVLVNNAGRFIPGEILKEEEGALEEMMATNLYSAYHISRGIIPAMVSSKRGTVFNICSIASIMAYPNGGSYSITKFAMYGMSKVMREELKSQGIRVIAVLPGATMTASWEGVDLPEERFIDPDDIANLVFQAYSLSDRTVVEDIVVRPQLGDLD